MVLSAPILLLILGCQALTLASPVQETKSKPQGRSTCFYYGVVYQDGASFGSIDDCNTCECNSGTVACTEMICTARDLKGHEESSEEVSAVGEPQAAKQGRALRPEEHWRPAEARDLSKYKPRYAAVDTMGNVDQTWEEHMASITRAARGLRKSLSNKKDEGRKEVRAACGIEGPARRARKAEEKIVGGVEATEHAWPWQVALFIDDAWFCGGSIISENYVLTAAHCADGASYFDVMAGAHNVRESSEPNRVEVTSYNGWTHPLWNSNDLSGDLALVELPSPLPMNDYISASCLPATGETPAVGSLVTVTGWGKPSDSAGGISPVLREVRDIPVMTNADCNAVYGIVGDGVVCIDTAGGRGSCNGDSGGPLVQKAGARSQAAGDKWTQVGIVSFGASAGCEVGMPAGFTRTEYYLDWIKSETGMP